MSNVLYLCNRKNPKCNESLFCYVDCFHTQHEEFAKNGPYKKDDDRFDVYEYGKDGLYFVERKGEDDEH